jgi:hypothetical protein
MKALLVAACFITLCSASTRPMPPRESLQLRSAPRPHPNGKWYMAQDGHAVFCYGPVRMLGSWDSGIERYATICRGGLAMVRLRD